MSYFLSEASLKIGDIVELTGEEARHISLSRRIVIGEIIQIQDLDGKRFEAEVINIEKRSLSVQAIKEIAPPKESSLRITIFQALIKEQPLDNIIQKITELGVDTLALFYSQNSVERFKEMEKKLGRWWKIAEEAAKQSGRVRPIKIEFISDQTTLLTKLNEPEKVFILEPLAETSFIKFKESNRGLFKIGILVGPEGGFIKTEVEQFSNLHNTTPIHMGPRILRADTAAISAATIVQSIWGDM